MVLVRGVHEVAMMVVAVHAVLPAEQHGHPCVFCMMRVTPTTVRVRAAVGKVDDARPPGSPGPLPCEESP